MNYGWTFVGIGFLCLLVLMGCAAPDASPEIPDQNTDQNNPVFPPDENTPLSPPVTRSFEQGFVPIPPQPITEAGWMDTFRLLGRNADVVLHHSAIDWNKFSENANAPRSADKTPNLEQTNFVALMAKQNQLNVLIVVDRVQVSGFGGSRGVSELHDANRTRLQTKIFGNRIRNQYVYAKTPGRRLVFDFRD